METPAIDVLRYFTRAWRCFYFVCILFVSFLLYRNPIQRNVKLSLLAEKHILLEKICTSEKSDSMFFHRGIFILPHFMRSYLHKTTTLALSLMYSIDHKFNIYHVISTYSTSHAHLLFVIKQKSFSFYTRFFLVSNNLLVIN